MHNVAAVSGYTQWHLSFELACKYETLTFSESTNSMTPMCHVSVWPEGPLSSDHTPATCSPVCSVNVNKAFLGSVELFEILLFLAAFSPVRMAEKDSNDIVLIEWIQPKYAFKLWA